MDGGDVTGAALCMIAMPWGIAASAVAALYIYTFNGVNVRLNFKGVQRYHRAGAGCS